MSDRKFHATCMLCNQEQTVRRRDLIHATQPKCYKCGGPLDLSQSAKDYMAEVQAAQAGHRPEEDKRRKKPKADEPPRILPDKEVKDYEWGEWPDMYRWVLKDRGWDESKIGWREFYGTRGPADDAAKRSEESAYAASMVMAAEATLYTCHRPYYRVFPAIAHALCHTEMRVDGEHLLMPFEVFEVCLPVNDNPLEGLSSCIAVQVPEGVIHHEDGRDWSLVIVTFDGLKDFWKRDDAGKYWVADIPISKGMMLEDSLAQTELVKHLPNPDLIRRLMRVVVGCTFFAQDRHELVLPDLPRAVIESFRKKGRQPSAEETKRILQQREKYGRCGWMVGCELELPGPVIEHMQREDRPHGEHRELTAGHLRRGHVRMGACGEGRKDRKPVFVAPCVVRGDLPIQLGAGHRIRTPRGVDWTPAIGGDE